ncbi:MAG: hypothetical protein KJ970_00025 [Candidatus Eisenbacteria bacterium]|uniref:Uncharacterized protein n=1 Tax=Eiseniibacteriota bacterium TaxID=2212470 RepID=A0A948W1W4_UNCEI|nr:hypothetical protein [Candidatus Eisenbacteria bacterium]MBU2689287.1 hypothetical protein [Candidatus Eisenbacteria bacterium]
MNTIICAGGSGSRVLESIIHLCASGLGPDEMRVFIVDPDKSNGNGTHTSGLLAAYLETQKAVERSDTALGLFHTKFDLLYGEKERGGGLRVWSPVPAGKTLGDILNFNNLRGTDADVARLLFTEEELTTGLDHGFLGRPAIGAAAMSLLSTKQDEEPWPALTARIKSDLNHPEGSRVLIIGSVFGGTGASSIHPLVRFLKTIPEINAERLKIAVVALVPYFEFVSGNVDQEESREERISARSERFLVKTKAAVRFYEHLKSNQDWDFEGMYWIGNSENRRVRRASGGSQQKNPAHPVELMAALASLEYFDDPKIRKLCHYCGPAQGEAIDQPNEVRWTDLPMRPSGRKRIEHAIRCFFLASFTHLAYFRDLLDEESVLDDRPYCIPWYLDKFALKKDWLTDSKNRADLNKYESYLKSFYFPWWIDLHRERETKLLRRDTFMEGPSDEARRNLRLGYLADLFYDNRGAEKDPYAIDRFFDAMVKVSSKKGAGFQDGVGAYVSLLLRAAQRYIDPKEK